ncbi:fibroblast growth factor 11 isoform X4 [Cervus elaphus]|uniref:fibroblast growth factor 11 isoform X4 n=1 Tax=Cervus canadensis TaxID=1574408 RepID=UPI001C9E619B|nr:fibroblast growth factor 11 isoform X4 [Cervus canadensis]XP_043759639.1 fibroblast growth factor 11 isoform X4 [Cervus elaphus]
MAALASSLIRQKREVREPGGSRPVSAQRRVCPRGTKSLCQKQLLILLSKVRLCGGRPARTDRGPATSPARPSVRPPPVTCAPRSWTPPGDPLRDSEIGPHGLRGPSAMRNSDTVHGWRPARRLRVVPPTRGYREVGREQASGDESCEGWRVVPVQNLSSKASSPNCSAARVSTSRRIPTGASRAPQRTPALSPTST